MVPWIMNGNSHIFCFPRLSNDVEVSRENQIIYGMNGFQNHLQMAHGTPHSIVTTHQHKHIHVSVMNLGIAPLSGVA